MNSILAQANLPIPNLSFILVAVLAVAVLVVAVLVINFGMIYIRALFSGAKVTLTELIALRLRRVPVGLIVDNRITAVKSGLPLSIDDLSTHYLAGGNVDRKPASTWSLIGRAPSTWPPKGLARPFSKPLRLLSIPR
jgi:uncharacterized protein YqfA (UPF0365 family)